MKVLVTGVKGQLGFDVMNELKKRGLEAVGADIEEMDKEIIQGLNIQFVDNMKEVLGEALA